MRIPKEPTPYKCREDLRPLCDDLVNLVEKAPLSAGGRAGLSVLMATHFFGLAMAMERRAIGTPGPSAHLARQIMEIVVEGLEKEERPKLVTSPDGSP